MNTYLKEAVEEYKEAKSKRDDFIKSLIEKENPVRAIANNYQQLEKHTNSYVLARSRVYYLVEPFAYNEILPELNKYKETVCNGNYTHKQQVEARDTYVKFLEDNHLYETLDDFWKDEE